MKLKNTSLAKILFAVVPALLLALVLQPSHALAMEYPWVYYTVKDSSKASVSPDKFQETYIFSQKKGKAQEGSDDPVADGSIVVAGIMTFPNLVINDGEEFDYWVADVDVYVDWGGSGIYWNWLRLVPAGTPIYKKYLCDSTSNMIYVDRDTTFTAYVKSDAEDSGSGDDPVTPDPVDPVTPDDTTDTDDSITVKPADSSTTKKTVPKTGDALPGAMAALCAGGVIASGVAVARKRCC